MYASLLLAICDLALLAKPETLEAIVRPIELYLYLYIGLTRAILCL